MSRGFDIAFAAEHILDGHTGNIDQAIACLDHLEGTKSDWRMAAAYLACSISANKATASDRAAVLALSQIKTALAGYQAAKEA